MTSAAKSGSPPKRKGGRTSKLTPDFIALVLRLVRSGQSPRRACIALGIAPATWARWHADMSRPDVKGIKRSFRDQLAVAQEEGIARLFEVVRKAAETDAAMALKLLAALAPNEFAPRKGVELSGPGGAPVQTSGTLDVTARMGVLVLPPEDPEPELTGEVVNASEPRALPAPAPSAAESLASPTPTPRATRQLPPAPEPEPVPRASHDNPMAEVFERLYRSDSGSTGGGTSW